MVTQVIWLQSLTLVWMLIECSVALQAALRSHSVALLAFGSDSSVEFISALVVLLQFLPAVHLSQARAARFSGVLLIALAGIVVYTSLSALIAGSVAEVSLPGMLITAGALVMMPMLGVLKRRKARELNNRALAADAAQSFTCAYLAAVTFGSLLLNALVHLAWLDSVAALLATPFLLVEAGRAWRGASCGCC